MCALIIYVYSLVVCNGEETRPCLKLDQLFYFILFLFFGENDKNSRFLKIQKTNLKNQIKYFITKKKKKKRKKKNQDQRFLLKSRTRHQP